MSTVSSLLTAKQQAEAQRQRDIKHHEARVKWLLTENPTYSDGTPVSGWDKKQMLDASLRVIQNPCLGFNTGPQA